MSTFRITVTFHKRYYNKPSVRECNSVYSLRLT